MSEKLGRINLLTPERVKSVKENEVKDGDVVSLKLVPKPQKELNQV